MTPHRALGLAAGSFLAVLVLSCVPMGTLLHALRSFPLVASLLGYLLGTAIPLLALTGFAFAAPLASAEADDERDAQVAAGAHPVALGPGWRLLRFMFGFIAIPAVLLGVLGAAQPGVGIGIGAMLFLLIVTFWVWARRRLPVALWPDRIVDGAGRVHAFATLTDYTILKRRAGAEQHTLKFPTGTVTWADRHLEQPQWLANEVQQRAAYYRGGGR